MPVLNNDYDDGDDDDDDDGDDWFVSAYLRSILLILNCLLSSC